MLWRIECYTEKSLSPKIYNIECDIDDCLPKLVAEKLCGFLDEKILSICFSENDDTVSVPEELKYDVEYSQEFLTIIAYPIAENIDITYAVKYKTNNLLEALVKEKLIKREKEERALLKRLKEKYEK